MFNINYYSVLNNLQLICNFDKKILPRILNVMKKKYQSANSEHKISLTGVILYIILPIKIKEETTRTQ